MHFWSAMTLSYASFFQPKTIIFRRNNYILTQLWVIWCCRDCWPLSCTPTCGSWRKPPPFPSPGSGSSTLSTNILQVKHIQVDETTAHYPLLWTGAPASVYCRSRYGALSDFLFWKLLSRTRSYILSAEFRIGKCFSIETKLIFHKIVKLF
jgi:hypothetical protein